MTKIFLLAGMSFLGALTLGTTASHATVFGGSASFTSTPNGDPGWINMTAVFPGSNGNFATSDLTAGGSETFNSFVTVTGGLGAASGTANIALDLIFSSPDSTGTDNQGGSATMTYNGFTNSTGGVSWTGNNGAYAAQDVTFQDGAKAEVDIYNLSLTQVPGIPGEVSGDVKVVIKDLADPAPVPEPGTLGLLASGLFGLGVISRRHRRNGNGVA
jgi:PEP-CTERM motif